MMQIKSFIFNSFQVNAYLLFDETGQCLLVDAACSEPEERKKLTDFIGNHQLALTHHINTHCHIDHVLGNHFIAETFHVFPQYHKKGEPMLKMVQEIGLSFGYRLPPAPLAKQFLEEGDEIRFGNSVLKVFYTPGHAEGSICLYSEKNGFVITGDVLFKETIGRTDLPSGDFEQLMKSIQTKLFTLPEETIVYPGHGPETNIGYEKVNNPFIR